MKQRLRGAGQRAVKAARGFFARRDPAECFIAFVLAAFSCFLLACLIGGAAYFISIFHLGASDLLLDFFNSLRDVAQGEGVYTERHVIYPPLANLVLLLLARLVPIEYLNTPYELRHTWHAYPGAILTLLFFFAVSFALLAFCLQRERYSPLKRRLLTLSVLLSFPVVFLLERGNVVILAVIALVVFVQHYDSESPAWREVALIALAVAAALKLYPALFGLALLGDRRFKDALRAALYAILLLLLPSFFFGGPRALWLVVQNTFAYSGSAAGVPQGLPAMLGLDAAQGRTLLLILYAIALVIITLASFLQKKPWKIWCFAASILLAVPSIFSSYNWLLFLPVLLYFMRTERLQGLNLLYFVCMTLPFGLFLPKRFQDDLLILLLALMLGACVLESAWLAIGFFKGKKSKSVSK